MDPRNEREAHRAIVESCPPCSGNCLQGRRCPDNVQPDPGALRWVLLALAVFWGLVAWGVVRCTS